MISQFTTNSVCSEHHFTPREVKIYTDIVCASVTNSMPGVKASVHVLVKGKKGESPAPEPAINDCKGKRSCLLDGEKRSVYAKERGYSWELKKSEGSQQCPI